MTILEDAIRLLQSMGVADVAVPFFLVFAIVFGVLDQLKLFVRMKSDGSAPEDGALDFAKRIHVIIALVMGLAVVFPHVISPNSKFDVVPTINKFLPGISIALIVIVGAILIFGLLTGKAFSEESGKHSTYVLVGVLVLVGYIFFSASGVYRLPSWLSGQLIGIVLTLAVFWLMVSWIVGEKK